MGIRPEDLQLANGSDPAGLCFDAVVEVVERLGSEILLDLRVGRADHGGVGGADRPRPARRQAPPGVARRPLHFFDMKSEAAV